MFKNLIDLISGNHRVIKFSNDQYIYPIFKNGSSSIKLYARQKSLPILINEQIKNIRSITVYLRDPKDRFLSGVNTFFNLEKKTANIETLSKIETGEIINKHYVPQYVFLLGLHRFFKGWVTIKSTDELYDLIPNRDGPWSKIPNTWIPLSDKRRKLFMSISNDLYTCHDLIMIKKYMGKKIKLKNIIQDKEIKNALS